MPEYLSPGVYVEEIPSGMAPIAGVGTSTAGFIGVIKKKEMKIPDEEIKGEMVGVGTGQKKKFKLKHTPVPGETSTLVAKIDGKTCEDVVSLSKDESKGAFVEFSKAVAKGKKVTCDYTAIGTIPPEGKPILCTNFSEFKKYFGEFTNDKDQKYLALAVHGFFNNGGTRCWVAREEDKSKIGENTLKKFEGIDEIAIVAAPGQTSKDVINSITDHCSGMGDRFAIIDGQEEPTSVNVDGIKGGIKNSDYAAIYFPWIHVKDPDNKDTPFHQPPSGHIAGVFARVDKKRGVHKAPANEEIKGCTGFQDKYRLSKAMQDGLNPKGINVLRLFNDTPTVWGARTIGGDDNGEWKYINVRRLFLFLRESIEEGTRWIVFEPNTHDLWAMIRRNITAFLTNVWRAGALFGHTPEEAFYVKCDEETNPPDIRDEGKVVTEIGVAVVKPAEFVIFRISQWAGPGSS